MNHVNLTIRRKTIKVIANALKPIFAIDYFFRPKKRYKIPKYSPARTQIKHQGEIPYNIWQTNYSNSVTLPVYINYLFNRWLTSEFEYKYSSDEDIDKFVMDNYSGEIADAFARLQVGAARSDFWRILVLLKYGGIYLDIDSNFILPPISYLPDCKKEMFLLMRDNTITNYFIASAPNNPTLWKIANKIVENIKENKLKSVFDMTGPTVVDEIVKDDIDANIISYRGICTQGQFTNKRFQYADKKHGTWGEEQNIKTIVR